MARRVSPLLGLALMVGGVIAVRRELSHLSIQQIRDSLSAIAPGSLVAAAGCTVLSYLVLAFYDRLAVVHVGRRISFGRTTFAAFCSYVLSHNLGFAAVSGAAVRFRLYGSWGFKPLEITRIIAFCSITYVLGACTLAALVLVGEPAALGPLAAHLPHPFLRGVGLGLALLVVAYVACSARLPSVRIWRISIPLPGPVMACAQVLVAAVEVAATASIAFVLLPPGIGLSYAAFLALYIACYSAGLIASVPGGLGVFDGAMVLGLSPFLDTASAIVVILVFRLYYYVVPLFVAGLLFAGHELMLRGDVLLARRNGPAAKVRLRPSGVLRESEADFSVTVAAALVVLCGAMLLALRLILPPSPVAFALPPTADPFPVPSGGVFDGLARYAYAAGSYLPSLIGAALVGMAIGLSQRVALAWGITLVLLCLGAAVTALDGEPAFVPGVLILSALVVAPFRTSYHRHAKLLSEPLAPLTIVPMLILLGCVAILGDLDPSSTDRVIGLAELDMLVAPGLDGGAELSVVLAVMLALLAAGRLVLPGRIASVPWSEAAALRLDVLSGHETNLPIRPSPDGLLFGTHGRAAIPFRRVGRILLGYGDPAGASSDCVSVIWRFRDLAVQEGREPAFWRVEGDLLDAYRDIGLQVWPLPEPGRYLCCSAERGPILLRAMLGTAGRSIDPKRDPSPSR